MKNIIKTKGLVFFVLSILIMTGAIMSTAHTTECAAKKTRYTISYNANKGKRAPVKTVKLSSRKKVVVRLSKKKPVRSGYVFRCWNTKKNGKGKNYRPGAKIKLKKKTKYVKLFAIWRKAKKPAKDTARQNDVPPQNSKVEVHFLDVGQGDATLITCDGESMLIDAGDNSKGTAIQSYLMSKKVKTLKYVIGTHPDADHIGGLDVVITKFGIDTLYMPATSKDTRTYDDVVQAAKYKSLKIQHPVSGSWHKLGGAKFQIVSLNKDYGDAANDWSICIRLVHGSKSFLFVGDAEEEAELDMVNSGYTLKSDVYKAAHHGSRTGSIKSFMDKVKPTYAVISCGEDNSYGHPHASVLNSFRSSGIKVFRTDEQGTILATSDGKSIKWNTSPSVSWKAGEPTGSSVTQQSQKPTSASYICNISSRKFHAPDCSAVSKMSPNNKLVTTKSRSVLLQEGYSPCGICKP